MKLFKVASVAAVAAGMATEYESTVSQMMRTLDTEQGSDSGFWNWMFGDGGYDKMRGSVIRIKAITEDVNIMEPFKPAGMGGGVGTGWAVSLGENGEDPIFVTNAHVVRDAHHLTLQMFVLGKEAFEAKVVEVCPKFDIALVRLVNPKEFVDKVNAVASLNALELYTVPAAMGLHVVAFGFPLGQEALKMSEGVVAGWQQVMGNSCIQSTAPISPGNSGGPLLDKSSMKVVGINFAKAASGGAENINYVIPAFRVKQMLNRYMAQSEEKKKERTIVDFAPLSTTTVTSTDTLYRYDGNCTKGIFVSKLPALSAFRHAEPPLEEHSFITHIGTVELDTFGMGRDGTYQQEGVPFTDLLFMREQLADKAKITSCKKGKVVEHEMSIEWDKDLYDKGPRLLSEPSWQKDLLDFEYFGDLCVMKMTINHLQETGSGTHWIYGDNIAENHLMITYVQPGSEADEVVMAGMVVGEVNGKPVRTIEDFRAAWRPDCADKSAKCLWTLTTDLGVLYVADFWSKVQEQVSQSFELPYLLTDSLKSTKNNVPDFVTISWPIEQPKEGNLDAIHSALEAALKRGEQALKEHKEKEEEKKQEPEAEPEKKEEDKKEDQTAMVAKGKEGIAKKVVDFFMGGATASKPLQTVDLDFVEKQAMGPIMVQQKADGGWWKVDRDL